MAAAQPLAGRPAWRGLGTDPGNRQLSFSSWRGLAAQQIVELKLQHEQERTHLFQQHNAEKDSLVLDHQREIDNLGRQSRATMLPHKTQTQDWRMRDSQSTLAVGAEGHTRILHQLMEQGFDVGLPRSRRLHWDRVRVRTQQTGRIWGGPGLVGSICRLKQNEHEHRGELAKSSQQPIPLTCSVVIADPQSSVHTDMEGCSQQQIKAEGLLLLAVVYKEDMRRQITHVSVAHIDSARTRQEVCRMGWTGISWRTGSRLPRRMS
ncbi:hypothetical protein MATL_G00006030 [Megalops atlanticus]|uniref:Uncharacterized protein n=1 Tax=Megalops atlanticus TaxID=7932 RepID=A0A9D3QGA4_MEGAT|nr:hypothetical protein MATL_G00006030 [Megalops atlanticus]